MKVLVIDEWIPWPLESGKKIRTFNLISRLAKKHEIIYLSYVSLPEEYDKVKIMEMNGIRVLPVVDKRTVKWTPMFYVEVLRNFISQDPFSSQYHIRKEYIEQLQSFLEQEKPDLVHCEWTNYAPYLRYVHNIPCVISSHNVESDIWRRLGQSGSNTIKRIIGNNQAKKIERLERYWYPKVEQCIAVSPEDKKTIESYGAKVALVDNGVDLEYYSKSSMEIDVNSIVFTASFDTFSNQDGAEYFVQRIYPIIKENRPNIDIWLVGKDPTDKIRSFSRQNPHIHVTGTVEDVRQYIARSILCVVPLRIGGGSRLKILEALAMKKAVISTTIGAEGLKITHGKNILLADTPDVFAQSVLDCLEQDSLRNSLAEEGYELVAKNYDWERLANIQDNIWRNIKKN